MDARLVVTETALPEGVVFFQYGNRLVLNRSISISEKRVIVERLNNWDKHYEVG